MYRIQNWLLVLVLGAALLLGGCRKDVTPERPVIPAHTGVQEDYVTDERGWISYPGALAGIDVSDHQGEIDWQRVKADGVDFAILRLGFRGYTAGSLNLDDRFEDNYRGAREAGVRLGVYFYSQATSEAEALEEAAFLLETLDGRDLELPVFFDWEEVQEGRTGGFATSAVGDYALAFCKAITEGGYEAGVYFNQRYGYSIMHLEALTDYSFWVAEYQSTQSFSFATDFWQYTGQGAVDGIDLKVDLDLMYEPEDSK